MPIQTKDLVDIRNGKFGNYTLHEFLPSTLNVYLNFRLNALTDTEREIIKAHKMIPLDSGRPLAKIEYKNEYYFGIDDIVKIISLQESFYPVMDQWIAEYHRVKALILESQVFLDDLFKTASSEPDLIALLPSIFYNHKTKKPTNLNKIMYRGKLPLSSQDIEQFAHKHSEIINQYKIIQLDHLTR